MDSALLNMISIRDDHPVWDKSAEKDGKTNLDLFFALTIIIIIIDIIIRAFFSFCSLAEKNIV